MASSSDSDDNAGLVAPSKSSATSSANSSGGVGKSALKTSQGGTAGDRGGAKLKKKKVKIVEKVRHNSGAGKGLGANKSPAGVINKATTIKNRKLTKKGITGGSTMAHVNNNNNNNLSPADDKEKKLNTKTRRVSI